MALFKSKKLLFLPNSNTSTLKFLTQLITKEGGRLIKREEDIDDQTLVVINDSFVSNKNELTKRDIFFKEFTLNSSRVRSIIIENSLRCVKASCVSQWIKNESLEIRPDQLIYIETFKKYDTSRNCMDPGLEKKHNAVIASFPDIDEHPDTDQKIRMTRSAICREENSNDYLVTKQNGREEPNIDSPNIRRFQKGNEMLIQAFEKLSKRYELKGDRFRAHSYQLATIGLENYPSKIKSGEEAYREISNIGPSIAKKIQIILDTGGLPGLYETTKSEKQLDYFVKCHNVGIYTAKKWEIMGLQSFVDASKKYPDYFEVNWPILFGWSYYEDWLKPISRIECEKIAEVVREELVLIDASMQFEILGSYSRGAEQCGDIDFMFYKPMCEDTSKISVVMEQLSLSLFNKGIVKCFLQSTNEINTAFKKDIIERMNSCQLKIPSSLQNVTRDGNPRKLMLGVKLVDYGVSPILTDTPKLQPEDQFMSLNCESRPCRRIDFFCCRYSEYGAARLHWVGPKEFNRWIRLKAIDKGLKLTQHGLFDKNNILLESFDEKRIFELLDEQYMEPNSRNHVQKKQKKI